MVENGKLLHAKDLQIVNGGQTTASLAAARKIDNADLSQIFVLMKLTQVPTETASEIVPLISRSANSQNQIKAADFFSTHEYHIIIWNERDIRFLCIASATHLFIFERKEEQTMKKCIALILVPMLCFALCACGESADTQPSQSESDMPHEHNYTSIVTPPTCTEKGYTTYTCACGKSYTADQVDIADHDYQETARVDATVEDDGSVTHTCSFCGDSYCDILYATGSIGLSYELNADGSYTVVGLGTCTDSHVVIPKYYEDAKVTAIGRRAFYDCATITEITIPDTITEIGQQVFTRAPVCTRSIIIAPITMLKISF